MHFYVTEHIKLVTYNI